MRINFAKCNIIVWSKCDFNATSMRYWYSFFYLSAMMLCAFALTAYLIFLKKSMPKGLMFLGGFSFPSACFGFYLVTFYRDYPSVPLIFKMIDGNWIGVMILASFVVLIKGAKMFVETDPRFKNLREALEGSLQENDSEQIPEEERRDGFNPLDHMHVEYDKIMEQDEYDI